MSAVLILDEPRLVGGWFESSRPDPAVDVDEAFVTSTFFELGRYYANALRSLCR
jgi:hypothetical protein